jgi:hypothetical protein
VGLFKRHNSCNSFNIIGNMLLRGCPVTDQKLLKTCKHKKLHFYAVAVYDPTKEEVSSMIFAELFVEIVPCAYDNTSAPGTSTYLSWTSDNDA